jgi:hypothetical protein
MANPPWVASSCRDRFIGVFVRVKRRMRYVFDVIFREGSVSDMQLIRTGGDPIQKRSVASQGIRRAGMWR